MALTLTIEPTVRNVRIDTTVPAGGATLTITRTGPSNVTAGVRAWTDAPVVPGAITARDFEAPIGVTLTYVATTYNAAGAVIDTQSATITLVSAGCADTWLNDLARAGNTLQVELQSLAELAYPVPATVHEIITRRSPIVTSDIAHLPEFELAFLTETLGEREQARALLSNGVPVLLRTPPDYGLGNVYFNVLGYTEARVVTLGTVPDRLWTVSAREVDRPDPMLFIPVGVATYQHVKDTFPTYGDLRDERVSYDAVLYDWSGSEPSDVVPWPPSDV